MAALSAIRAGLAAAITAAIPVTEAQCTGYVMANPVPPFFDIELAGIEYDEAMARGLDRWLFKVRGVVAATDNLTAQKNLDDWCVSSGTGSVKAALEADRTLGGVVQTLRVSGMSEITSFAVRSQPNNVYLGAEWTVEIYARG